MREPRYIQGPLTCALREELAAAIASVDDPLHAELRRAAGT